jgi:hypothetical protein
MGEVVEEVDDVSATGMSWIRFNHALKEFYLI